MSVRCVITISYDGTAYGGWQVQPNAVTVQQRVEETLARLIGERPKVHGSGRTDRGVHARAQVAHFDLTAPFELRNLARALNALLPADIRVTGCRRGSPDFHARRSAASKEYRYFIWNGSVLPPFLRSYRAHVVRPLDERAMQAAADLLVGRHDFAAFSANPNREVVSTVRELRLLKVARRGREIAIRAEGDGFLYKMVRSLAGLLIRVGEGAVAPDSAAAILRSRVRTARVPTAPAQGLFLWRVRYGGAILERLNEDDDR